MGVSLIRKYSTDRYRNAWAFEAKYYWDLGDKQFALNTLIDCHDLRDVEFLPSKDDGYCALFLIYTKQYYNGELSFNV